MNRAEIVAEAAREGAGSIKRAGRILNRTNDAIRMITGRQNEIEQIMVRCARVGFSRAAEELQEAMNSLIAAKCALVQESREQEVRGK